MGITYTNSTTTGTINYSDDNSYIATGNYRYVQTLGVITQISLSLKLGSTTIGSCVVKGGDENKINIANVPEAYIGDIVDIIKSIISDLQTQIDEGTIGTGITAEAEDDEDDTSADTEE